MSTETTQQFDQQAQDDGAVMAGNQETFFGAHPVNVQQQYDDATNSVTVPGDVGQQIDATGDAFLKDAPNLPFSLPFGLNKIFGIHPKE